MEPHSISFQGLLEGDFRSIWAVDAAWGRYEKTVDTTTLTVCQGTLALEALELPYYTQVSAVTADGKPVDFTFAEGRLSLSTAASASLVVTGK